MKKVIQKVLQIVKRILNRGGSDLYLEYKLCNCPLDYWEVIVSQQDENYGGKDVIYCHCDCCSEDFAVLDYETKERIDKYFPSAHSMDTSFYALSEDGYLVEFFTGEDGVLPDYPTYSDIESDLRKVVEQCIKEKCIQDRIKILDNERYKYLNSNALKEFKDGKLSATEILSDLMYYYSSGSNGVCGLLSGTVDICGNVYEYELSEYPTKSSKRVQNEIRNQLKYLPVIKVEETIRFYGNVEVYNVEIDYDFITMAVKYVMEWKKLGWNEFYRKIKKYGCNEVGTGVVLLNLGALAKQKAVVLVAGPEYKNLLETGGIICFDAEDPLYQKLVEIVSGMNTNAMVVFEHPQYLVEILSAIYHGRK